jgi:hypothetical protein
MRAALLVLGLLVTGAAHAAPPEPVLPAGVLDLRLEKARPPREKLPTLRFLKENRDFLRGRFDALRGEAVAPGTETTAIDPRWLEYQRFLATVRSSRDSLGGTGGDDGANLLARVERLADLEARLDRIERQQDAQLRRLAVLQQDFTGEQRTALAVVLRGGAGCAPPERVEWRAEDGAATVVTLDPEQRAILMRGGALQVWHEYVEPRDQVFELVCAGAGWEPAPAFVALAPERDRLTLVQLDLRDATPAAGSAGLRASTWRHDTRVP